MHMVQTVGLTLASDPVDEEDQPKAVGLIYVMLLVGMVVSALIYGALLENYSPGRLTQVIQGRAVVTVEPTCHVEAGSPQPRACGSDGGRAGPGAVCNRHERPSCPAEYAAASYCDCAWNVWIWDGRCFAGALWRSGAWIFRGRNDKIDGPFGDRHAFRLWLTTVITRYFDSVEQARWVKYELVRHRGFSLRILDFHENVGGLVDALKAQPVEMETARAYEERTARGGAVILVSRRKPYTGSLIRRHGRMANWPFPLLINRTRGTN